MKTNPPNRAGEIISHVTMGVLGLALLYGGYRCLRVTWRIWQQDFVGRSTALPGIIGIVLVLLGGLLCIAAVVPASRLEKMFSPPSTTIGEEPESRFASGLWFLRWW